MNIFAILQPLFTAHTASVQFNFSKLEDGDVDLMITPLVCVVKDTDSDMIQKLKAALSTPIRVRGKPDEIGAALVEHVNSYVPMRRNWEEQLAIINADVQKSHESSKSSKSKSAPNACSQSAKPEAEKTQSEPDDGFDL